MLIYYMMLGVAVTAFNVWAMWKMRQQRLEIDILAMRLQIDAKAFNEKLRAYNGIMAQEIIELMDHKPTVH